MDLKKMKGLIRKEWCLLKWGIIILFLMNIAILVAGPYLINRIYDLPLTTLENARIITGIWFVFNMFVGVGVLFTSLEKELKQRDIWLHATTSMWQLVGVKVVFAASVTFLLLLLDGGILTVTVVLSDGSETIPKLDGILSLLSVMISIFLKSIYIMAFGFMFWALYQMVRSQSKDLSAVFTMLFLFAGIFTGTIISELFRASKILTAIKEFVPVKLTEFPFYTEDNSYFFTGIVQDGVIFTIGGLILYGGLALAFFVVGAKIFEKRVGY